MELCSSFCSWSADFWRGVSGPAEERLLHLMSYGMLGCMLVAVVPIYFFGIPYGRYTSRSFGFPIPATLAWTVQESPASLVPLLLILCSDSVRLSFWTNRILLGLFLIHYAYRSFIFPFLIRGGKPTPLIPFLLAFLFCLCNGYMQGRSLSEYVEYPSNWLIDPRFILGFIAWITGLAINIQSDHILRNLRKPGETGYKIPRGGMFEYVTGANYFGEVLEWFGYALACSTIESVVFAISTLIVLGNRAHKHHRWYYEKFEDYPQTRKILIPWVF
ncbi:3-oxo-5-alpha-steroid 4-dehydrogenase 1 isoform X1 [Pogona vitticeps]